MERIITLLALCLTFSWASADDNDDYLPNELIVQYVQGVTNSEKEAVRLFFSLNPSNTQEIGSNLDHWFDLTWPIYVPAEGGGTIALHNSEDLRDAVDDIVAGDDFDDGIINDGGISAFLNNADLNYLLYLYNHQSDPQAEQPAILPLCGEDKNDYLYYSDDHYDPSSFITADDIEVYILDQIITDYRNKPAPIPSFESSNFEVNPDGFDAGGTHGYLVLNLIRRQLELARIDGVNFYSVNLFDNTGVATYARLLDFIDAFNIERQRLESLPVSERPKAILNLSASFIINPGDVDALILMEMWAEHLEDLNVLLSSSAGNYALNQSDLVYPACGGYRNEVTAAGTMNCFDTPWRTVTNEGVVGSNGNREHFEIATEATRVLSHVDGVYEFVNGTSFSTALVTGGVVQLLAQCEGSTVVEMKDFLIDNSSRVQSLQYLVKNGTLLNVDHAVSVLKRNPLVHCPPNSIDPGDPYPYPPRDRSLRSKDIHIAPNPFRALSTLTIPLQGSTMVEIQVYNAMGQQLMSQVLDSPYGQGQLQWQLPTSLRAGSYLLRVRVGNEWQQQMVIKQ